ncbi:hypothetical protein AB4254_11735 [Vibrio breoganii]
MIEPEFKLAPIYEKAPDIGNMSHMLVYADYFDFFPGSAQRVYNSILTEEDSTASLRFFKKDSIDKIAPDKGVYSQAPLLGEIDNPTFIQTESGRFSLSESEKPIHNTIYIAYLIDVFSFAETPVPICATDNTVLFNFYVTADTNLERLSSTLCLYDKERHSTNPKYEIFRVDINDEFIIGNKIEANSYKQAQYYAALGRKIVLHNVFKQICINTPKSEDYIDGLEADESTSSNPYLYIRHHGDNATRFGTIEQIGYLEFTTR